MKKILRCLISSVLFVERKVAKIGGGVGHQTRNGRRCRLVEISRRGSGSQFSQRHRGAIFRGLRGRQCVIMGGQRLRVGAIRTIKVHTSFHLHVFRTFLLDHHESIFHFLVRHVTSRRGGQRDRRSFGLLFRRLCLRAIRCQQRLLSGSGIGGDGDVLGVLFGNGD